MMWPMSLWVRTLGRAQWGWLSLLYMVSLGLGDPQWPHPHAWQLVLVISQGAPNHT